MARSNALRELENLRIQLSGSPEIEWAKIYAELSRKLRECEDVLPGYGIQRFADKRFEQLNKRFQQLLKQVNERLKRYRWTPVMECGSYLPAMTTYSWQKNSQEENWENESVRRLLGQATNGGGFRSPSLIDRFRQCRQGHKWFYAITSHQECCSERCRKKIHSESPEAHSQRADYMQRYRRALKECKEREDAANSRAFARESRTKGGARVHL